MKFTALVLSRIAEGSKFVNNYCECTLQGPLTIYDSMANLKQIKCQK